MAPSFLRAATSSWTDSTILPASRLGGSVTFTTFTGVAVSTPSSCGVNLGDTRSAHVSCVCGGACAVCRRYEARVLLERLGLGLHDLGELGEDGLVEAQIAGDDGRQLELERLQARVGLPGALDLLGRKLEAVRVRALTDDATNAKVL